jgi:uncharacterized protein YqeY
MFDDLNQKINEAMKARDTIRVSTLRMLSSEIHNKKIEKQDELNDEDKIQVVQREIKKRKDAIDAYKKAGADEKRKQEEEEMKILQEFLPEQLSEDDVSRLVDEVIKETSASGIKDMGKVIGIVMGKVKGKAEGSRVAALVKEKLV